MSWSPPTNPATVRQDAIRVLVGDVLASDEQIQDEQLAYFLARYPDDDYQCASFVAGAIAGRYARQMDSGVGPAKVNFEKRMQHFLGLAQYLWNVWQGLPPDGSAAGGVGALDAAALIAATDQSEVAAVEPFFTRAWPP
ncbi:MAG TPA: hypothetical protein VFL91_15285 [Thermomicrobiales bacterium]|nr:hypothetical protein [Thermomicrobiales bacterium]